MPYLTPEDIASRSKIHSEREFDRKLNKGVSTALNIGSTALGAGLGAKIAPFLNELIPADLALKGINKLNPKLGSLLKKGMDQGLDLKSGLDYIRNRSGNEKQPAKTNVNVIQQYSPELHDFIESERSKGRPILEAGALAQVNEKFKKIIKRLENDHKTPFSALLQSTYGDNNSNTNKVNQPQQQSGGMSPSMQRLSQLMEQGIQMLGK